MYMCIVMTGDRFWTCRALALIILRRLIARYGTDITIVHGGGSGVEQSIVIGCEKLGLNRWTSPLDFQGGTNSPMRHDQMIAGAELCIVLHHALATNERIRGCRPSSHRGRGADVPDR
jgi:hypothetical protein